MKILLHPKFSEALCTPQKTHTRFIGKYAPFAVIAIPRNGTGSSRR